MALGTLGSTLNDELNRLANGGTYRDMNQMVDEALAAKQWANRENINPYSTDTVGILNEIAGLGLDKRNWLDFNGVCNYIAGTTGLPAAAALRQVYPTTDLLTGVASYYVDATAPTNWGSLGYVRLNGVTGNNLSTPDATPLDVTGDIDIRMRLAVDDWTPSALSTLLAKWGTQRSYLLYLLTDGKLRFIWSTTGSDELFADSTVATGITDGAVKWIRVTLDVNNGASGRDIKFFTSDDGSSWTQLGTTITQSGTTSIFNSNENLTIGTVGGANNLAANLYNTQIFASLDGTDKRLDVNIATDYRSSNQSFFTATTGQTVTVNGVDTIANLGAAGSLLPTTLGSSTAADSNDPKFLDHTGTNYVYADGLPDNNLRVPDAAALDITGDIDIKLKIAPDSWANLYSPFGKYGAAGQRSWLLRYSASGITLITSADGTATVSGISNVALSTVFSVAGTEGWIRATLDVDDGSGNRVYKFYTSTNGTTWTQLGTDVVTAGTTSIFNSTATVDFISVTGDTGGRTPGKYFRGIVQSGFNNANNTTNLVLDVDTSVITAGSATSFTAVTGQTVTINRSTSGRKTVAVTQPTWLFGTDDYMEVNNRYMSSGTYLYLPGVSGNYASTPTSAALEITGDIDLRVKVALDDWTPATEWALIAKQPNTNLRCYSLYVNTSGFLIFAFSQDGPTQIAVVSSVATGITDGATKWVRATRVAATGVVKFFLSDDGVTWTQLGTDVTGTSGNMFSTNTGVAEVGSRSTGTALFTRGKFFRAQVRNGIDGTVAFDANFETSITSLLQTSFTESSANAATVTINRSGSAYRSAGITAAGYLYPGATNTFAASATDFLNFGANDSFTALAVFRQWNTAVSNGRYLDKRESAPGPGYALYNTGNKYTVLFTDGTTTANPDGGTTQSGTLVTMAGVVNRSNQIGYSYVNNTSEFSPTISTITSSSSVATLRIGRATSTTAYQDFELIGAAVFRQALTFAQVRQLTNYFRNREVYL